MKTSKLWTGRVCGCACWTTSKSTRAWSGVVLTCMPQSAVFSSGRVKGSINSILVEDELVKVSLSIYDTDGLEGLYVPISQFRETSKDVASSAMSGSMNMNTSGYGNSLAQWGMQAVNNAYQKTSNAISKAIKKNKVKLKYGTFVYLVNGRENRN